MFLIQELEVDDPDDHWSALSCSCDIDNIEDPLISRTVKALRDAYGENELFEVILSSDSIVENTFNLDAIRATFRNSLPNPESEGNKIAHFKNSRSEPSEILASLVLSDSYSIEFPLQPQRGKTNANQPVLGFDGWGILKNDEGVSLVLVQVKTTEAKASPPSVADELAAECQAADTSHEAISRALCVMVMSLSGEARNLILAMMERVGEEQPLSIVIAPVIVRGTQNGTLNDLTPVREVIRLKDAVKGRGAVVTVGAQLNAFGAKVTALAREVA